MKDRTWWLKIQLGALEKANPKTSFRLIIRALNQARSFSVQVAQNPGNEGNVDKDPEILE